MRKICYDRKIVAHRSADRTAAGESVEKFLDTRRRATSCPRNRYPICATLCKGNNMKKVFVICLLVMFVLLSGCSSVRVFSNSSGVPLKSTKALVIISVDEDQVAAGESLKNQFPLILEKRGIHATCLVQKHPIGSLSLELDTSRYAQELREALPDCIIKVAYGRAGEAIQNYGYAGINNVTGPLSFPVNAYSIQIVFLNFPSMRFVWQGEAKLAHVTISNEKSRELLEMICDRMKADHIFQN